MISEQPERVFCVLLIMGERKLPTLWPTSSFVSTTGDALLSIIKQESEQQKHVE